jgi:hypothetical protein
MANEPTTLPPTGDNKPKAKAPESTAAETPKITVAQFEEVLQRMKRQEEEHEKLAKSHNALVSEHETLKDDHEETLESLALLEEEANKRAALPPPELASNAPGRASTAATAKRQRVDLEAEGYTGEYIHDAIPHEDPETNEEDDNRIFGLKIVNGDKGVRYHLKSQLHTWEGTKEEFRKTFTKL